MPGASCCCRWQGYCFINLAVAGGVLAAVWVVVCSLVSHGEAAGVLRPPCPPTHAYARTCVRESGVHGHGLLVVLPLPVWVPVCSSGSQKVTN